MVDTTDQAGRTTHNEYDLAGRLTAVTTAYGTADAQRTAYTYYDDGRKHTETAPGNRTTTYNYDAAGRLTSVVDAANHTTQYGYDDAGNQTSVTDANNHTTRQEYDERRRLKKTTYHDNTTTQYTYDGPGNLASVTDQANNVVSYTYDAANRLRSVIQENHPDQAHKTTAYNYDVRGNLTTVTDANTHTTQSAFDLLNRLNSETLPSGNLTQTRQYDTAGNLTSLTDYNGNVTTYTYDNMNRLLTKRPDPTLGEQTVRFTYTSTGKRASMEDASGTTIYTYDNQDRLKTKATPQGTLSYTYDAAGNVASIQSSNTHGTSVAYTWDNLNRLSTVVDNNLPAGQNTTTYSYDPASNLATVTYPNGLQSQFTYDTLNRLTDLNNYHYQLGATGNRNSATEPGGRTLNWTYDNIYRLTTETINLNTSVSYTLDPVGNRLSQTSTVPGIPTTSFTYDANDRILSTEVYDNNGNTTTSGGRTFTYDFENRLKNMNGSAVTIQYDADGNRVVKTVGGVTTRYLVDELNPTGYAQVVEEVVNGAVQRIYTYGLQRINQEQLLNGAWTASFYGYDGLGSVRFLTDSARTVTDTYDYDAWGNAVNVTGSTPNFYLYRGEQYDPDLRLYYLRERYLNPLTGRFLTRDPEIDASGPSQLQRSLCSSPSASGAEMCGGASPGCAGSGQPAYISAMGRHRLPPYLYADADPTNKVDPSGRAALVDNSLLLTFAGATATVVLASRYIPFVPPILPKPITGPDNDPCLAAMLSYARVCFERAPKFGFMANVTVRMCATMAWTYYEFCRMAHMGPFN